MKNGEVLNFDRRTKCDWCGHTEICAITHYGTTHYNRLICVECAMSINNNDIRALTTSYVPFDLNHSQIRFSDLVFDSTKEENDDEE